LAASFSIEAVFKAVDRMSNPMRGMNRNTSKFSRALRTDFAKAQRSVDNFSRNFKKNLGKTVRNTFLGIGFAAVAGLGMAGKEFIDFQQTATNAAAKFGSSAEEFERIKAAARDFAAVTQFNAVEAAAGLEFFAKAGFTADEAMGSLKQQIDLATVAGQDLQSTMDITSDLLSSLGLASENSAEKIANLDKLTNSLGLAVNMANVDLNDLFETLKVAGPVATEAGEDMNSLIAITAALGGAGIKGSMGATALKNAYTRLAAPTDKVHAALKQLGLTQKDFIDDQGNMKSMVNIMSQLGDASKDLGGAQRLGIFSEIFGKNAVAGATNLAKSLSQVDLIFQKLESDAKISEIADRIRNGLGMQVKILQSGLLELGFKFIEAFEDQGAGALNKLINIVQTFNVTPIINGMKTVVDLFLRFLPVLEIVAPLVLGIVAAWKLYRLAMFAAAAAQLALNTVMNASPIGFVITAIGLLIGAGILLVKNWDTVSAFLIKVWGQIKEVGISVWEGIKLAFSTSVEFMKRVFFTFADLILTTYGNIFKSIIEGASRVGKFFGFDTTGIDNVISKIEDVQRKVREQSFIGGSVEDTAGAGAEPIQAPVSSAERAASNRETFRGELTVRDPNNRTEITRNPRSRGFRLQMADSGDM
jgi:TP901 family phage tail tape measure protein